MGGADEAIRTLRRDPAMAALIDEHGVMELSPAEDTFERLVVSILNQQLSTASAAAIRDRVFDRFEVTPEAMIAADASALREAGLSGQKVEYVRNVAEAFRGEGLTRATFADMTDEEVVDELTRIRGVGVWTAKMFLIFCLGREDVFPIEDLGVRKGMEVVYGDLSREEMKARAAEWRPFRSYGSLYLWRAYD